MSPEDELREAKREIARLRQSEAWWVLQVGKQGAAVGACWEECNRKLLDEINRLRAKLETP